MTPNPEFRTVLFGNLKRFLDRIRASLYAMHRNHLSQFSRFKHHNPNSDPNSFDYDGKSDYETTLNSTSQFLNWLMETCFEWSHPNRPMSLCLAALTIQTYLTEIFGTSPDPNQVPLVFGYDSTHGRLAFPISVRVVTIKRWERLALCLQSRYDVMRQAAYDVLKRWPNLKKICLLGTEDAEWVEANGETMTTKWWRNAEVYCSSPRPFEAEAGAMLTCLLVVNNDESTKGLCPYGKSL
jgi:hypothetical protein